MVENVGFPDAGFYDDVGPFELRPRRLGSRVLLRQTVRNRCKIQSHGTVRCLTRASATLSTPRDEVFFRTSWGTHVIRTRDA